MRQKRSLPLLLGSLTLIALVFLVAKQIVLSDAIYYAIWSPKFAHQDLLWPEILHLPDRPIQLPYIKFPRSQDALLCYRPGLATPSEPNAQRSHQVTSTCPCSTAYYGPQCSIPSALHLNSSVVPKVVLRHFPRRLIYFFSATRPETLELRVLALADVVDAFVVQDLFSNHSDTLLARLKRGWLRKHQNQIAYVLPEALYRQYAAQRRAPEPGFALEPLTMDKTYIRQWSSRNGGQDPTETNLVDLDPPPKEEENELSVSDVEAWLTRQGVKQLGDVRLDDLVIYTKEPALPTRELLFFLKTHDRYPLPLSLGQAAVFPITKEDRPSAANVVTFQMFRDWYNYDASCLASNDVTCRARSY